MRERERKVRIALFPNLNQPYRVGHMKTAKEVEAFCGYKPSSIDTWWFTRAEADRLPSVESLPRQLALDI